ncbi:ATP-binding cassette domain-containing protein [Actinocorallia sp. API 0066]|uniref:ABC transporter ATP-binding protein n=1 Tax=Actinocorallia sp. API 0066 TaxID=2896846 RepID=UPI001E3DFFE0|nr:ATP-binding cassette domain-containing protein [Actinocorallia sp. API 0066]MCD0448939.1 ATP-binding cassette domain-containing protein [Actinocorallia sp. API 0066]
MGDLELDSVTKSYGDRRALDGLSFRVRSGELFGFVGSNGAGKTTAMRIILGVLAADSGEVRYDGAPLDDSVRRTIGYMPEERGLYPKMKVREQLVYLARLRGLSANDARKSTDVWLERLGVAARAGEEVQKLSLGNQQRVQLAAALVHGPRLLVLDEPFSGLDPVAVDVMSDVLRERAAEGAPVVFSSHQLDLVERLCDRVGIVRDGRLVADGSVDELRSGGEAKLVCRVEGAAPGWADAVPGVVAEGDVFALEPGADEQALLRAALEAGRVTEFAWRRPSLTDLFRDVVAGETPKEAAA